MSIAAELSMNEARELLESRRLVLIDSEQELAQAQKRIVELTSYVNTGLRAERIVNSHKLSTLIWEPGVIAIVRTSVASRAIEALQSNYEGWDGEGLTRDEARDIADAVQARDTNELVAILSKGPSLFEDEF